MSGVLRWEDPPPSRGPHPVADDAWGSTAEQLRACPNRWGVVYEGDNAQASTVSLGIKRGSLASFRPGGTFEAVYRKRDDVTRVYARYVGDSS